MENLKSRLGSIASIFAVVACYGTLASVALLSLVGISVEIDERLMINIVTLLLIIALSGMVYSWHLHRNILPLLLSLLAAIILFWVFYGRYTKELEILGFVLLIIASIVDFRSKKKTCLKQRECHQDE
ncbi:MAG: hypothetical protein ISEC1_P1304 [Thiomicrorhabdus sp.]|nr:MAG: hypothetical protein ISEC1_P1304 [Thiomicrorhabdus sp.]